CTGTIEYPTLLHHQSNQRVPKKVCALVPLGISNTTAPPKKQKGTKEGLCLSAFGNDDHRRTLLHHYCTTKETKEYQRNFVF
ncbi:MAG: hypothetical protein ACQUHE_07270, partial [Bacteroidia bacterium]